MNTNSKMLLQRSLAAYYAASTNEQIQMVNHVRKSLEISKKGKNLIGFGFDADYISAGKKFIKHIFPKGWDSL